MKIRLIYILVFALIILNLGLVYNTSRLKEYNFNLINEYSNLEYKTEILSNGFFHSFDFKKNQINSSLMFVNNKEQLKTLNELTKDRKSLILFVHGKSCSPCIYDELEILKENRKHSSLNIIVAISGLDKKEFNVFINSNDITEYSYRIPFDANLGFENNPIFYSYINERSDADYFYAPNKDLGYLTDLYLKKINKISLQKSEKSVFTDDYSVDGIRFKNLSYDFGKVKNGKTYSTKFAFTNNMEEPLLIKDIKTTCGCTISEYDKSPIFPKSKSDIKIDYKAEHIGKFQKQIMVFSNAKNKMVRLIITGEVIA